MVSDKLKQIIFKQLYKELSNIEIIPYQDSIYFIDRENKYWYFEYEKSGNLWWRYNFFTNFFLIFSLESNDYQKVMGDWVEEVLNCRVSTTIHKNRRFIHEVEEVLNCRVSTTKWVIGIHHFMVEEVLNCRVNKTELFFNENNITVEEILKVTN